MHPQLNQSLSRAFRLAKRKIELTQPQNDSQLPLHTSRLKPTGCDEAQWRDPTMADRLHASPECPFAQLNKLWNNAGAGG